MPEPLSHPAPKRVTAVVGLCGNIAFTAIDPPDAERDCLTECLADVITESGYYNVKCSGGMFGDPLSSDYGYECTCEPILEKIEPLK